MTVNAIAFALPALATAALGTALLVPLRDERAGRLRPKRASIAATGRISSLRSLFARIAAMGDLVRRTPAKTHTGATQTASGEMQAPSFAAYVAHALSSPPLVEAQPTHAPTDTPETKTIDSPKAAAIECADERAEFEAATEAGGSQSVPAGSLSVRPIAVSYERMVPLTRLPLRSCPNEITWFDAPGSAHALATRRERLNLLERYARGTLTTDVETLLRAHREEDADGRRLALRALAKHHARAGIAAFDDALRTGTDDERAIAIDGLVAANARDRVRTLLHDRVDAIAARAAIAYVGSNRRDDFVAALAPLLDDVRVATLLALLAGYIE